MKTYQFEIDDELWNSWKDTVPRSKSLDTRLRELIKADRDGRVSDPDSGGTGGTVKGADGVPESAARHADQDDGPTPDSSPPHAPVHAIVGRVADSWDDDGRLDDRRAAADAALELLLDRGQLSKSGALDELLPEHEVAGQSPETWWVKTVRPVLREIATYRKGTVNAYVLDEES